ncbi:MAG TPA: L-glyceraldehyde 3-phosphate reductase [Clostridiales bacterium]|nr:L-glyceraldehyde 3-phosphate reductase [Clostridiales bacterium]
MAYNADPSRYKQMKYNACGNNGLYLPAISLGLWHNFGNEATMQNMQDMILNSFDLGITHFDIANNYGPPAGAAEENFGKILKDQLKSYRDELIISTKAGFYMWDGPYGDGGSKKYLIASIDQSLKRAKLEYFDIFYHHRADPNTPAAETAAALDQIVRQGKALYIGTSNYTAEQAAEIIIEFEKLGTPYIIHQPIYNMLNRGIENGLVDILKSSGVGIIAYCPLAQGLLTDKYLNEQIPQNSRADRSKYVAQELDKNIDKIKLLKPLAQARNQTMAQMAIAWLLNTGNLTSVLIGASRFSQIAENVAALNNTKFSQDELDLIDRIVLT